MIKIYSAESIKLGCQLCQDNHLFHPTGQMKRWLRYTLDDFECDKEIAKHVLIYYKDGKPVAAFIILKGVLGNSYNCGVYVLPEYRKRGIDKALIKRARQKGFDVFPWMGSNDAATFYKKVFGNENIPSANITSNYE